MPRIICETDGKVRVGRGGETVTDLVAMSVEDGRLVFEVDGELFLSVETYDIFKLFAVEKVVPSDEYSEMLDRENL